MQFGIKSLLGAMVLLAAFVMGVFQFSPLVCFFTLLLTHSLSPAIWLAGFTASRTKGGKAFFLGGIITGITPWIATFVIYVMGLRNLLGESPNSREFEERFVALAWWSSSGLFAIAGGLLSYWICRCNQIQDSIPATVVEPANPLV